MSTDFLMPSPLNGHLVPASLAREQAAALAQRQSAFDKQYAPSIAKGDARRAFMQTPEVTKVEIAAPVGEFVDPSLTDARVTARVNGEMYGFTNKHGGVEFVVPTSNGYGKPQITPVRNPFSSQE